MYGDLGGEEGDAEDGDEHDEHDENGAASALMDAEDSNPLVSSTGTYSLLFRY